MPLKSSRSATSTDSGRLWRRWWTTATGSASSSARRFCRPVSASMRASCELALASPRWRRTRVIQPATIRPKHQTSSSGLTVVRRELPADGLVESGRGRERATARAGRRSERRSGWIMRGVDRDDEEQLAERRVGPGGGAVDARRRTRLA